jgi:hypothetical protein
VNWRNPVTDGFFAYTFQLGVSNDYPKLAVWPDGYYLISQQGYDRQQKGEMHRLAIDA